ncbi:hypothetical protein CQW39_26615 [Streptomyces griseofuscus]|uniref:hypothetical protein n=1 Tax=Streptomyces griseofuscus TaxID=146922 RepID=UPI000F64B8BE|nr:hypothetical protein [Streptomyces griseofuscus]RRQ75551.1 hypothetical protein CQW39_26615 [Streptomyces griseofuscus]
MEWWKTIAPLVGVVLGGLGTLLGQKLSDARTLRRDRLLAREDAKVRLAAERATLQREAIIEIQRAFEGNMAANDLPPGARLSEQFRAAATESALRLRAHIARLEDRELAAGVLEWLEPHRNAAAARAALDALHDRLSRHLRGLYADQ